MPELPEVENFKDNEDQPKYSRVLFFFDNGFHLSYISKRRFGFIDLADSIEEYVEKKKLGKDAGEISFEEFYQGINNSNAPIKQSSWIKS